MLLAAGTAGQRGTEAELTLHMEEVLVHRVTHVWQERACDFRERG